MAVKSPTKQSRTKVTKRATGSKNLAKKQTKTVTKRSPSSVRAALEVSVAPVYLLAAACLLVVIVLSLLVSNMRTQSTTDQAVISAPVDDTL